MSDHKKQETPGIRRRDSLKLLALGAASFSLSRPLCGQSAAAAPRKPFLIPADKKLTADWVKSLTARGTPAIWKGEELPFIGMPVGGIGCGQLYLAGDGRLWLWDVFKSNYDREPLPGLSLDLMTMNGHYTGPVDSRIGNYNPQNGASVEQGFAVRVKRGGDVVMRTLDAKGFQMLVSVANTRWAGFPMPIRRCRSASS
jgi:non-lysosomal glucosylceramidase